MKKMRGRLIVIAAVAVVVLGLALFVRQPSDSGPQSVKLSGQTFTVTVVKELDELMQGLSHTGSLPEDQGMLFVFPKDDKWSMWMKDMKYAIDIVWINHDKTVVHTVKDAQPSSYPKTRFEPPVNARYVLELASGTIERTGIKNGDKADLPSGV